jgi:uncharacterized membrane protein YfcA
LCNDAVVHAYLLLLAAGIAAGLINSVAGGGSFITFPTLVLTGVPSVVANATSTVALFPGVFASAWAYRSDFERLEKVPLKPAIVVSIGGGIAGALLLLFTAQKTFDAIIPWILLMATIALAIGPGVSRTLNSRVRIGTRTLIVLQFFCAIYGGYFGGAVGIIMLAVWSMAGLRDVHAMNAGRTLLGGVMNAAAVICFVAAGKIWWLQAALLLFAAVIGGYAGALMAKRVNPALIRGIIIAVSAAVTIAFFVRGA